RHSISTSISYTTLFRSFLYRRIKAVLPSEDYIVPIGKADVKRSGNDISVITYGAMVHLALEAAQVLANEGIDLEVVDLRTLIPRSEEHTSELQSLRHLV